MTNKKDVPQIGSLQIQKTGKVNEADPTDANKDKIDGTYRFIVAAKRTVPPKATMSSLISQSVVAERFLLRRKHLLYRKRLKLQWMKTEL